MKSINIVIGIILLIIAIIILVISFSINMDNYNIIKWILSIPTILGLLVIGILFIMNIIDISDKIISTSESDLTNFIKQYTKDKDIINDMLITNQDDINNINNKVNPLVGDINSINDRVNPLISDINNIEDDINSINDKFNPLIGDINNINNILTPIPDQINNMNNGLSTLYVQIPHINSMLLPIPDQITDMNSMISNISNNITNINNKYSWELGRTVQRWTSNQSFNDSMSPISYINNYNINPNKGDYIELTDNNIDRKSNIYWNLQSNYKNWEFRVSIKIDKINNAADGIWLYGNSDKITTNNPSEISVGGICIFLRDYIYRSVQLIENGNIMNKQIINNTTYEGDLSYNFMTSSYFIISIKRIDNKIIVEFPINDKLIGSFYKEYTISSTHNGTYWGIGARTGAAHTNHSVNYFEIKVFE